MIILISQIIGKVIKLYDDNLKNLINKSNCKYLNYAIFTNMLLRAKLINRLIIFFKIYFARE